MDLQLTINNIKFIKNFELSLPLHQGLYAITGENASGKSTIMSCVATLFYSVPMSDYFGKPNNDSEIKFQFDRQSFSWHADNGKWKRDDENTISVGGFFEGSIIYGNRFKNTYFSVIKKLDNLNLKMMNQADEYVRKNLGLILHNDSEYYQKLYRLKGHISEEKHLAGQPYFYENDSGNLISQARMSTGENLLISILNSLNIIRKKRERFHDNRPCFILLDEIEIALHASALRRLVEFLNKASFDMDLAVYFSTHSLELIRDIKPQNIFYLTKQFDSSLTVTNPCYPAFATRNLYSDDGYGNDLVILVEDDLAKIIVERILQEKQLINNIRIKVLPTGGWQNTIAMAYDIVVSRLLLKNTKILVILDRDIKPEVPKYLSTHKQYKDTKMDFLPIASLEKYLKLKILDKVDPNLITLLDNYVFQAKPISSMISQYKKELAGCDMGNTETVSEINNGKRLWKYFLHELRQINKDRSDLIEVVVKYLITKESELVDELANYLSTNINNFT